ncbi:LPS export ABC transporter periplasmic protein LptC [Halioglobus japonicus]|uniref:LPS export ABC transporter periplasmic protein LptC n=1 Tax=Halioglobus japonicus TaxID=930805 RepID=A0AAP8SNY4_9GAMM|nr:LPS export ABC transporter periplasmic protein LptC [Halioglobus japonicus]AQA19804.1 LPS export ABC transporter periplasmic protein LptC [Halioglobus japonicus]PLW87122.1 LPS export ABC transporter periplasmic protein LptC [Halioglobus japonicus]GHD10091.1 hypothetical protein GCM10007052_08970 [Halioglobus japonicus]
MPRPTLQILLALTILLAATYYWNPRTASTADVATSERHEALPLTYIEGVRTWAFDEQGYLSDILEAERVDRFREGNYSMIMNPKFYSHSADGKTWSASATRGRWEHKHERLLLRKNVVLSHDQTGTRMNTHLMDIFLDTQIAESNRQVTITQGKNQTVADGMVANLENETISLKPNVESIYVPSP